VSSGVGWGWEGEVGGECFGRHFLEKLVEGAGGEAEDFLVFGRLPGGGRELRGEADFIDLDLQ
jgi:hypothetical protein